MSRQQTVQHTPVKLKHSYLTVKSSCVDVFVEMGDMKGGKRMVRDWKMVPVDVVY